MQLQCIHNTDLSINTYLFGDPKSKQFAVIDPIRLIDPLINIVTSKGYNILYIIETHVHADFVSGSIELKNRLNGKPVICSSKIGGAEWAPAYADRLISDGDEFPLGPYRLKAMHTPGHTPEHIILLGYDDSRSREMPCVSFTGDLLFVGGVGRPDLLGEEQFKILSKELHKSLFDRLKELPDFLEIYPAHGAGSLCGKIMSSRPSSTLGYERHFNPSFNPIPQEKWISELQKDMPAAPISFPRLKKVNVKGAPLLQNKMTPKALSNSEVSQAIASKAFIIDVRDAEIFAAKHLKNSVNIPYTGAFCNWAGMVVPDDKDLAIILPNADMAKEAAEKLWLLGLDNIIGYAVFDQLNSLSEMDSFPMKPVEVLAEEKKVNDELFIIDVRTPSEWASGHIDNAHHIELAKLSKSIGQIPRDRPITVTCGGGFRASAGASLLKREGIRNVANLKGGMQAWQNAGLPITKD